ncbi:MAG TPA: pilus assembly PilX N-terminal domain-containing protein, partial [Blastocatellia bacterium]
AVLTGKVMEGNNHNQTSERGMALITALLATTMLLGLGLAVVYSTTYDNGTTKVYRAGEQSFFSADAGIGIARRAITQAFSEEIEKIRAGKTAFYKNNPATKAGQFPDVQVIPDPDAVDQTKDPFYQSVFARANELVKVAARDKRLDALNGSSFAVTFKPLTGSVSLITASATQATQAIVLRYAIEVTGKTEAGGSATVNETGRLSSNITLQAGPSTQGYRDFSFSGFGAFWDDGDPDVNSVLTPGTFSGAVHTNTRLAFYASWQYTFRNAVSQVDPKIRYWTTNKNNTINIPTTSIQGITLSKDGYRQVSATPLPQNTFSQEYAVINRTGLTDKNSDGSPVDAPPVIPKDSQGKPLPVFDSSGRVTPDVLAANLRNTSNQKPTLQSGALPQGVYISSSDGANIDGAGIYVKGDVTDFQLYSTNGDQYYVITQGSATTTIRVNYTANQTTLTSGSFSKTYTGVFTDMQDPANPRPGAAVYVAGSIKSLRGGTNGSTKNPAVASKTALTITAQRNLIVTGDLKYADAVANSDGTPVSNIDSVKNVLGLFTNDGNLFLDAKKSYVSSGLNIEINAAVVAFDSDKTNNNGKSEGGITSYTGSGHSTPGTNDRIRLVGSDVEKNNSLVDYNYADIYFDVRFSGGTFRPPFFPGTSYTLGPAPVSGTVTIASIDAAASTAMSWFREYK